ncbi:Uncharacterised protein [Mycolicibacterium vanbaalenii]|uniref:Uncharacterized protein n=1 Tax=Mycolicibacterium vanbaalenii TaxID=110539 RepID=A0A5S9R2D8_MYCVN|nr:hypothetical protein [Mycolicibacterium vanbaalenii]CAA0127431.1 Uncharacterised protein [Mycolicibacterium vanbaalenii]
MTEGEDSWDDVVNSAGGQHFSRIRITFVVHADDGSLRDAAVIWLPSDTTRIRPDLLAHRLTTLAPESELQHRTHLVTGGGGAWPLQLLDVVVQLGDEAWKGAAGALAYDLLKRVYKRMAGPLKLSRPEAVALHHQEALREAANAIKERFDVMRHELEVEVVQLGEKASVVIFNTRDRVHRFTVQLEEDADGVTTSTVIRTSK